MTNFIKFNQLRVENVKPERVERQHNESNNNIYANFIDLPHATDKQTTTTATATTTTTTMSPTSLTRTSDRKRAHSIMIVSVYLCCSVVFAQLILFFLLLWCLREEVEEASLIRQHEQQ